MWEARLAQDPLEVSTGQLSGWGEKEGTVHTNATITNTAETKDKKKKIRSTKWQQRMPCPADYLGRPPWPP